MYAIDGRRVEYPEKNRGTEKNLRLASYLFDGEQFVGVVFRIFTYVDVKLISVPAPSNVFQRVVFDVTT